MSTSLSDGVHKAQIEGPLGSQDFSCNPQDQSFLLQLSRLREHLEILDRLDAEFGNLETLANEEDSQVHTSAITLWRRLEAANEDLYHSVRSRIIRAGQPATFLQWMKNSANRTVSDSPSPCLGFDWQDELVSGILQLREPAELDLQPSSEMVPYQPTPVRHVLDLIAASFLSKDDVLIDLGSGLGHVPLLVSMLAEVRCVGIEIQPAYVASAQECAQSLRLNHIRFIAQDAREADLSRGTVFYLYSPFTGSILSEVLGMLQKESTRRPIRVCSLGPSTKTLANQMWLQTSTSPDTGRIVGFTSR